jgi:hypothetical protein
MYRPECIFNAQGELVYGKTLGFPFDREAAVEGFQNRVDPATAGPDSALPRVAGMQLCDPHKKEHRDMCKASGTECVSSLAMTSSGEKRVVNACLH